MNNNKLIAEFMDLRSTGMSIYKESEYKYHTSWGWLMPVGEKIDAMFGEDDEVDEAINRVHNAVLSFDIDNTYRAIVEFIKEYNDDTI